jgi:hypothetical protein
MPMPMPKQTCLDLDDEAPAAPVAPVSIAPECKPTLIDLMAQAIVAVWLSAQEVDHDEH